MRTSDIAGLFSMVPVDRSALKVTSPGQHFNPEKKVLTNDSDYPIPIREPRRSEKGSQEWVDVTGVRFGRFVVIGIARDINRQWVVRCDCGRYSTRSSKSVRNPANTQDRCEHCRHLAQLKRSDYYRATGIDKDINQY